MQAKLKIKKDDMVKVVAGNHKGLSGKVVSIDRNSNRVIVEGVNLVTKHQKPSSANPQGGLVKMEAGLHISNLVLLINNKPTKVGRKEVNGKIVRFAKSSGEVIK